MMHPDLPDTNPKSSVWYVPGKPVAYNYGLLPRNHGLLYCGSLLFWAIWPSAPWERRDPEQPTLQICHFMGWTRKNRLLAMQSKARRPKAASPKGSPAIYAPSNAPLRALGSAAWQAARRRQQNSAAPRLSPLHELPANGCFHRLGVLFVLRALVFRIYIKPPDCWKLPNWEAEASEILEVPRAESCSFSTSCRGVPKCSPPASYVPTTQRPLPVQLCAHFLRLGHRSHGLCPWL